MRSHTCARGQPGFPRWPLHEAVSLISRAGKACCCRAAWRPLWDPSTASRCIQVTVRCALAAGMEKKNGALLHHSGYISRGWGDSKTEGLNDRTILGKCGNIELQLLLADQSIKVQALL